MVSVDDCWLVAALATVSREPGQALTGAAISGVALCEGRLQPAIEDRRFQSIRYHLNNLYV